MKFSLKISLIILLFFFIFCKSTNIIQSINRNQVNIILTDQKIQFLLPPNWQFYFSSKKYFHLVAKEDSDPYGFMIEYRGLINTTKNQKERELYAEGWYKAIKLNYPQWEYIEKTYEEIKYNDSKIYNYQFLGTFFDGKVKMKKLGFLRFYKDRIHAIYYTSKETNFHQFSSLIKEIDQNIVYDVNILTY
jgi:hypothetical protein